MKVFGSLSPLLSYSLPRHLYASIKYLFDWLYKSHEYRLLDPYSILLFYFSILSNLYSNCHFQIINSPISILKLFNWWNYLFSKSLLKYSCSSFLARSCCHTDNMTCQRVENNKIPFRYISYQMNIIIQLIVSYQINLFRNARNGFEWNHMIRNIKSQYVICGSVSLLVSYSIIQTR